jgi:hypothetical protein
VELDEQRKVRVGVFMTSYEIVYYSRIIAGELIFLLSALGTRALIREAEVKKNLGAAFLMPSVAFFMLVGIACIYGGLEYLL